MKFSGTKKFSLNSKRIQNFVSRNKQTKQNTLSQETKKHKVSRNKETRSLKKQYIMYGGTKNMKQNMAVNTSQ